MAARQAKHEAQSLLEFAHARRMAERRKACPVCRLPDQVKDDLRRGRKSVDRETQILWLKVEHRIEITDLDFTGHYAGHHEEKDRQALPGGHEDKDKEETP